MVYFNCKLVILNIPHIFKKEKVPLSEYGPFFYGSTKQSAYVALRFCFDIINDSTRQVLRYAVSPPLVASHLTSALFID